MATSPRVPGPSSDARTLRADSPCSAAAAHRGGRVRRRPAPRAHQSLARNSSAAFAPTRLAPTITNLRSLISLSPQSARRVDSRRARHSGMAAHEHARRLKRDRTRPSRLVLASVARNIARLGLEWRWARVGLTARIARILARRARAGRRRISSRPPFGSGPGGASRSSRVPAASPAASIRAAKSNRSQTWSHPSRLLGRDGRRTEAVRVRP